MKKIVAFSIVFFMIFTILSNTVLAASVQKGTFNYMPAFEDMAEEVYFYSDDYFANSGKEENEHLTTMSYNLALATFEIRGDSYIRKLYADIGYENISTQDMVEKPTLETVGTAIAHKKVGDSNIVAVAIRGEKYDSEWGNNFIVGKEGDAKGLSEASQKVIQRIKDYIDSNGLENVKIWMAGYSRAGALADLTGVYINNNLNEFNTTADDLYIYTFEAPAASVDDTIYDNIYNIVNTNDLIPFVYPYSWGFYANGKVIKIDSDREITTYKGLEEVEEYNQISSNGFLTEFSDWLGSRLDRETYSTYLDEPLSKLLDIYFSKDEEGRQKVLKFLTEDLKGAVLDDEDNFSNLKPKVWSVLGHNSDYLYQIIANDLNDILDTVRNTENGLTFTDEEYETLKNSIYPIIRAIGPVIADDASFYFGIDYDEYYATQAQDYAITDEEMGRKYGKESGQYDGYEHGLEGLEKNDEGYEIFDDYGPDHDAAFITAYKEAYNEAYELGVRHRNNIAERGEYDGKKYSYNTGFYDGNHGNDCIDYDEYLYEQDWMTQEYIDAYNAAYKEEYLRGYADGQQVPLQDEEYHEPYALYHVLTLVKNFGEIYKIHYPQYNLRLLQSLDSYYYNCEEENPPTGDGIYYVVTLLLFSVFGIVINLNARKEF